MKTRVVLFILFFCVIGKASETCQAKRESVKDVKDICDELNRSNKTVCERVKKSSKQSVTPLIYGIAFGRIKMKGLFKKMEGLQNSFMEDSAGCPEGCIRIAEPVVEISTAPTEVIKSVECKPHSITLSKEESKKYGVGQSGSYFTKSFRLKGAAKKCQEAATDFAQETLIGDNKIGEFLEEKKCASPCSYSSVTRLKTQKTSAGECAVDLELEIICGPPKKEREWKTTATLVKSFRCEGGR